MTTYIDFVEQQLGGLKTRRKTQTIQQPQQPTLLQKLKRCHQMVVREQEQE